MKKTAHQFINESIAEAAEAERQGRVLHFCRGPEPLRRPAIVIEFRTLRPLWRRWGRRPGAK